MQGSIVTESLSESSHTLWLISGLGLISALALAFQSLSAPHLNLSLFGLLVYVEPILLVAVSIALGKALLQQNGQPISPFGSQFLPSCWKDYAALKRIVN
jgi:EamA domain-containing membrane protein RarD